MKGVEGKVAVVTGGTSGIGLACAKRLAAEGALVYACARKPVEFEESGIIYHSLDVTDPKACRLLCDEIIEKHGRIDILVADAGITMDAMTAKMTDEQFDTVIDVDLKGVFNIVRYAGPIMEKQGQGSIVTVSSLAGERGNVGQANYAAAKAGVIAMTKGWAKEFSRKGAQVRSNVVAPGITRTKMISSIPDELLEKSKEKIMLKRIGEPEEIAAAIVFLASDEASYINGAVIDVNGGM